jgi:hypothetical protein
MNNRTKKILTWSFAGVVVAFIGKAIYDKMQNKDKTMVSKSETPTYDESKKPANIQFYNLQKKLGDSAVKEFFEKNKTLSLK